MPVTIQTEFQKNFFTFCTSKEVTESIYKLYVDYLRNWLEEQSLNWRNYYPLLKSHNYICENEKDLATYTMAVWDKHINRFALLYEDLFSRFEDLFTHKIDLIVWSCGSGLDLLALYDQMRKEGNFKRWLTIGNLVLIDISTAALQRTKEIAQILFPAINIVEIQADLSNDFDWLTIEATLTQLKTFKLTPRLHLFCNIVDLIPQITIFINNFCKATLSASTNTRLLNDFIIVFSPDYQSERGNVKISLLEDALKSSISDAQIYTYAPTTVSQNYRWWYHTFQLLANSLTERYNQANDVSQPLMRALRILCENDDRTPWDAICELCDRLKFIPRQYTDIKYFDYGEEVRHINKESDKEKVTIPIKGWCIFSSNKRFKPIVIVTKKQLFWQTQVVCERLGRELGVYNPKKKSNKVWANCYFKYFYYDINKENIFEHSSRLMPDSVGSSPESPQMQFCGIPKDWISEKEIDIGELFYFRAEDLEPLAPAKNIIGSTQSNVIFGLKPLCKVRGAGGTGKTYSLLWRAHYAYLRLHAPILILSKTNSLYSTNSKRFAATFGDLRDALSHDHIQFLTYSKFLCKYAGKNDIVCTFRTEGADGCNRCNEMCLTKMLSHNEAMKIDSYGAVYVDEAQICDPRIIKAIYRVTKIANPWREFYLFADEAQTIRTCNSCEADDDVGKKLTVKVPDVGFGRWATLKEAHRQTESKLMEICHTIQHHMTDYERMEVLMVHKNTGTTKDVFEIGFTKDDLNQKNSLRKVVKILEKLTRRLFDITVDEHQQDILVLTDQVALINKIKESYEKRSENESIKIMNIISLMQTVIKRNKN